MKLDINNNISKKWLPLKTCIKIQNNRLNINCMIELYNKWLI